MNQSFSQFHSQQQKFGAIADKLLNLLKSDEDAYLDLMDEFLDVSDQISHKLSRKDIIERLGEVDEVDKNAIDSLIKKLGE